MSIAHAKSLILQAQDHLNLAQTNVHDSKQHDMVGYNLAQACEKFLKALCDMRELPYPDEDNDLDELITAMEEAGLSPISSHADIIELTAYNSARAVVSEKDRLDLAEYLEYTLNLKKLVGEQLQNY